MKKVIKQVTVTGADNSTSIEDMLRIQEQYPFVEWGILLSLSSEDTNRFPSQGWIEQLADVQHKLALSGHLCGRWVRDLCGGENTFYKDRSSFRGIFDRYQLNFHAYTHRIKDRDAFIKAVASLCARQVIFQFDDVNNELLMVARESGLHAVPLFDTSGGAGVLPKEWPEGLEKMRCGYAGGLSPENLKEQMEVISERCGGAIWIDAETHLRSDCDRVFDMEKVCKFLEEAKPWVMLPK